MDDTTTQTAAADAEPVSVEEQPLELTQPVAAQTTRYKAPRDTSGITFSTGRVLIAVDGIVTVPDDLLATEIADLARYGFTAI